MKCPGCGESVELGDREPVPGQSARIFRCANPDEIQRHHMPAQVSQPSGIELRFLCSWSGAKVVTAREDEDVPMKCCPRFTWGDGTHDNGCRGDAVKGPA